MRVVVLDAQINQEQIHTFGFCDSGETLSINTNNEVKILFNPTN